MECCATQSSGICKVFFYYNPIMAQSCLFYLLPWLKMFELSHSSSKKEGVEYYNSFKVHKFLIWGVCLRKIPYEKLWDHLGKREKLDLRSTVTFSCFFFQISTGVWNPEAQPFGFLILSKTIWNPYKNVRILNGWDNSYSLCQSPTI